MKRGAGLIVALVVGAAALALASSSFPGGDQPPSRPRSSDGQLDADLPQADIDNIHRLEDAGPGETADVQAIAERWYATGDTYAKRGFPKAADYCRARGVQLGFHWSA